MPSVAARIKGRAVRAAYPVVFRRTARRDDLVRLGTAYGGWWIPGSLLNAESVCLCAGVGTDISFDTALIETFGCRVWAVDPTPRTIDWIAAQPADPRFTFVPVGVSDEAGEVRFYAPRNPAHVSHSVKNIQGTSQFFTARVATISGLMAELGLDRIDLLKLDVEGAEHDTIRGMLRDGIRPRVLCVEYDQPEPLSWGRRTTGALAEAGYDLVKVEVTNLTFVRADH